MLQVPDSFLRAVCAEQGIELPAEGSYATGIAFPAAVLARCRRRLRGCGQDR